MRATASISPMGEVIFESPPETVFTRLTHHADMAFALGRGTTSRRCTRPTTTTGSGTSTSSACRASRSTGRDSTLVAAGQGEAVRARQRHPPRGPGVGDAGRGLGAVGHRRDRRERLAVVRQLPQRPASGARRGGADGYQYYGLWESSSKSSPRRSESASATKRSQRSARNSCRRSRTTCRRRRSARPRSRSPPPTSRASTRTP